MTANSYLPMASDNESNNVKQGSQLGRALHVSKSGLSSALLFSTIKYEPAQVADPMPHVVLVHPDSGAKQILTCRLRAPIYSLL